MEVIKEIRLARTEDRVVRSTKTETGWQDIVQPVKVSTIGVIRTRTYAKSIAHLQSLVAIAKQDFPLLNDDQIQVTVYSGRSYAGTYGIEFPLPDTTEAPEGYRPITELELTVT